MGPYRQDEKAVYGKRMPTRERGRPARTRPGTASAISSTGIDQQERQDLAWAEPVPFPPAGWRGAPSQANERHATGVHAGGTPAFPGGAGLQGPSTVDAAELSRLPD